MEKLFDLKSALESNFINISIKKLKYINDKVKEVK